MVILTMKISPNPEAPQRLGAGTSIILFKLKDQ
jgi:hypothetical protein